MTLLALVVASWILVSLVAAAAFSLLATAVKRGAPSPEAPCAPVLPLLAGVRTTQAPVVSLPAQRQASASGVLTV